MYQRRHYVIGRLICVCSGRDGRATQRWLAMTDTSDDLLNRGTYKGRRLPEEKDMKESFANKKCTGRDVCYRLVTYYAKLLCTRVCEYENL